MDDRLKFRIGEAEVTRIPEITTAAFTPNGLIPDWDLAATAAELPALVPTHLDEAHRHIVISVHSWLVRRGTLVVLVDAGIGNGKTREAALFDRLETPFLARLAAAGVAPGEVDRILLTHLHTDHVGWLTRREGERWAPTFPNARISLSRRERDRYAALLASDGPDTPRTRLFVDSILPVMDLIDPVEPDGGEVVEGFTYHPTPGHSFDHMSIALESRGARGLFAGDVLHHPVQVAHPRWSSVFSEDRAKGEASRRRALDHAAGHDALVFTSHFAGTSAGRVVRQGEGFAWREVAPA